MNLEFIICPVCAVQGTSPLFNKDGFSIVTCNRCNLKYVNPRLKASNLEENYIGGYYPVAKRNHIQHNEMEWLQMKERLDEIQRKFPHKGRILDLGCGMGTFLYLARKKGWETFGVDLSQDGVGFAKESVEIEHEITKILTQQESPKILTLVLNISNILSIPKIIPTASRGKPTVLKITNIATKLADGMPATPIEVIKANKIIKN